MRSTVTEERTPIQIFTDVAIHEYNNPTHGFNCSCMDSLIRELRQVIIAEKLNLEKLEKEYDGNLNKYYESEGYKVYRRWSYVLHTTIRDY